MNRLPFIASSLVIIFAMGLGIYLLYLKFWPVTVIEIKNAPVPVDKTEVRPGETIALTVHYCKHLPLPGDVRTQFVNDILILLAETSGNTPVGCAEVKIPILIPTIAPEGEYHILRSITYRINVIREETVTYISQPFRISK